MDNTEYKITLDERAVRALHSAVTFTLDTWTGQGEMDQEQLLALKSGLQAIIFEYNFMR